MNKLLWTWLYNPPLILIAVTGIHAGWVYGLYNANPLALSLTTLGGVQLFLEGRSPLTVAIGVAVATILATIGLLIEPYVRKRIKLLWMQIPIVAVLLIPQYILVFTAIISDAYIMIFGQARTYVPQAHTFITRDIATSISVPLLFGLFWISLLHTYGILQRYFIVWQLHEEELISATSSKQ